MYTDKGRARLATASPLHSCSRAMGCNEHSRFQRNRKQPLGSLCSMEAGPLGLEPGPRQHSVQQV